MIPHRKTIFALSWLLLVVLSCCSAIEENEDQPPKHENRPRFLSIFSRPGDRHTEKNESPSLFGHIDNVFKGGSIGVQWEAQPLAPLHKIAEKAKKLIPIPLLPGSSFGEKHDGAISREDLESEWEKKDSKKPKSGDPHFEEIGKDSPDEKEYSTEVAEEDYYVTEPIEDIIQPRVSSQGRRRRSIDSKVFHVALEFLSNAKPYQVNIKHGNVVE